MSDKTHAVKMMNMAFKDLRALKNMTNEDQFDTEIFGFHAQQTVEKSLKAYLSFLGLRYEKTHV